MSTAGRVIKVLLLTTISIVVWFYVINKYFAFEILYETVYETPSGRQIKQLRSYYTGKVQKKSGREITESEYLRSEIIVQTENVARLLKSSVDKTRVSNLDGQFRNAKADLDDIKRKNQVITTELTSIRDGLQDLQSNTLSAISELEDFLTMDIANYISYYGIEQFRRSVYMITDDLKNHITQSTGGNLLISDLRVSYVRAQNTCEQMGTFLVTIESEEKMRQVQQHVGKLKRWDIWIGLNRLNEFDDYKWDNKAPVVYTNWDDGQPNRRDPYGKTGEEKCTIMWSTGKWHDYRCEVVAYFVCEKPVHSPKDIMEEKVVTVNNIPDVKTPVKETQKPSAKETVEKTVQRTNEEIRRLKKDHPISDEDDDKDDDEDDYEDDYEEDYEEDYEDDDDYDDDEDYENDEE